MKDKLIELFEYNTHYNKILIEAIASKWDEFPERVRELISHILNSHTFWNNRIVGKPDIERWTVHSPDSLLKLNDDNHAVTADILDNRQLSEIITFRNSKGGESTASIEDIYFHLVNHGTYHRGQIALLFRQSGVIEPIQTDLIAWKVWGK